MTLSKNKIPMWVKLSFTAFMAILVPFYWSTYGASNFLYFCDVALFLTLIGVWTENKLFISLPATGILIPQFLWVIDFAGGIFGMHPIGMTDYMFDSNIPLFARGLSLFHGWLPFLLLFLLYKVGYDKRAFLGWTVIAWGLMIVCYTLMPAPGTVLENINAPVNINYVFGFSDAEPQQWMHPHAWFALLMIGLPSVFYYPTHRVLNKLFK